MPRSRSLKSLAVESAIIVAFVAIIGHISVNFWERYIIQSELSEMKTSLHFLKNTLINIGSAYDKLHQDLKGLAEFTEKKQSVICNLQMPPHRHWCQSPLDRPKLHDMQVGAAIGGKNAAHNFPSKAHKSTEKKKVRVEMRNAGVASVEEKNITNTTTMTRNPPKSTGVGGEVYSYHNTCRYKCYDHYTCCNDPFTYWTV